MRTSDFTYELPDELIAQAPASERTGSRLMELNGDEGIGRETHFRHLPALLAPGDLLVFNNTRVLPARLFGHKPTGGRVELLIERIVDADEALAQGRPAKSLRAGQQILIEGGGRVRIAKRDAHWVRLHSPHESIMTLLNRSGHIPLPPYIRRPDAAPDAERYQTVFAREPGAVAAPTAGLHFDQELLDRLAENEVNSAQVTLHVGSGTFKPVREPDPRQHLIHQEFIRVPHETVEAIEATRAHGGRIIAVGTTVVRSLETASRQGWLQPYEGETDLYILPGYRFSTIDGFITNFHLPESTLLMLVCAAAGRDLVLSAYRRAVQSGYRFFSYGDAMLVWLSGEAKKT